VAVFDGVVDLQGDVEVAGLADALARCGIAIFVGGSDGFGVKLFGFDGLLFGEPVGVSTFFPVDDVFASYGEAFFAGVKMLNDLGHGNAVAQGLVDPCAGADGELGDGAPTLARAVWV
jgi:hypothetical protein